MSDIDDFQRSQARSRRVRFAIMGLVLASPFLWLGWTCHKRNAENDRWREEERKRNELSASEKTELDKMMTEMRATLADGLKAFPAAVTREKIEAAVPGTGECPANIGGLDPSGDAYSGYGGGGIQIVKPGETPKAQDLAGDVRSLDELAADMKKAEDGPDRTHLERARSLANGAGYEVWLVGERSEPLVLANEYEPGRVRGTVFVYAASTKRIECTADVDVENAAEIEVSYTTSNYDVTGEGNKRSAAQGELQRDLGVRLRKAIRAELRAVR